MLPYVRDKITRQPELVNLPAKTNSVLACAIFGSEHFGRPDIIDAMGQYLDTTSLDTRLALVRFLLDNEALTLLPEQPALCAEDQTTWNQVQQKVEYHNSRANQEQFKMQREYWDAVSELFEERVQILIQRSRTAPRIWHKAEPKTWSIFRFLRRLRSKAGESM